MSASRIKIVVFGLSISSSWGNGHATLWRGLARALGERGHRFIFFEKDAPYHAAHRDLTSLPGGGELILYSELHEVLPLAIRHVLDADAAIVTSYCPDAIPASDLILDGARGLRAFYDLDTPVTLERHARGQPIEYIGPRGLGEFDLVLSFTGGRSLGALREAFGARKVVPLHGSADPSSHRPVPGTPRRWDLSYLGTYARSRQPLVDALLLEPARRLTDRTFAIGGAMYPDDFPWLPNVFYLRHVAPPEHPGFFCASRFTLNVTRAEMARFGCCPSGRLFEAAACGVPCISDGWEGIEAFYEPGREIVLASSAEEVVAALSLGDAEVARLARAARARTLAEHTADHRAAELVAHLGGRA